MRYSQRFTNNNGFQCLHCHFYIFTNPILAGVNNRNHCPYCLWSRHLDLYKAGDRLAVCKAGMQPIGLTLKRTRKKYGRAQYGELMLIHQCTDCGKISVNRIAADDDTALIYEIYQRSFQLDRQIKMELDMGGIYTLDTVDGNIVHAQLFGEG